MEGNVSKLTKISQDELEKAKKLSDEYDPNEDPYSSDQEDDEYGDGFREIGDDDDSEGDAWLKENDPQYNKGDYDEYNENEDEDAHRQAIDEDYGDDYGQETGDAEDATTAPVATAPKRGDSNIDARASAQKESAQPAKAQTQEVGQRKSRFAQPSREDLVAMRQYTRPWEQRARETEALRADPSKNPELARHGHIIEARNQSHADRSAAYRALTSSDEYKNADPIAQMEMDDNFEKDWSSKNPEHLSNAMMAHQSAHEKGKSAKDVHAAAKDAKIRNILEGGATSGGAYSLEEGMQHAGGTKGEEGTQASIMQDPSASFAMGNQDFVRQYAKNYNDKAKKVKNLDDMINYDEGSKRDIKRILGEGPQKDPKVEKFFAHYHPLIAINAHKTLNRLGLDPKHPDIDMSMLHEAGMHGLMQAINDYDHDNTSKASFATHAGNKIRGLQMTAMKNQDHIPSEVRQAQKKFAAQQRPEMAAPAPKTDLHNMITQTNHPKAADMTDRLKRIDSARTTVRRPAGTPKPAAAPTPTFNFDEDEE